ncbi:hypothetical protein DyAD56_23280 [Dyella sp. AD56]|uniref:hypothetical protein n=1 Tax=Dyella sp. AD56 TaxID=1528744 RepID=UPI000C8354D3|nr:hypothetical protein [Dyella sp. AD56]PMQ02629.1 hypothetical protein DyAD56_23280 [Dyella sp. AD56]
MVNPPADADIIQDAYADRLKALFDNYVDVAPSDPDGAKAKFVAGVTFLRNVRAAALQALPTVMAPAGDMAVRPDVTGNVAT